MKILIKMLKTLGQAWRLSKSCMSINAVGRIQIQKYKFTRAYSDSPKGVKVTICGAAGCTGQPLALLLKQCPLLDEIALYDVCATCGYGMELSHVDTKCKVSSYSGSHMLCDALKDAKVVVIVARNQCDSFENSAPICTEMAMHICTVCPDCFTLVATEPVESMVSLIGEIQRLHGSYNPRRLMGCVELNCIRANTALADFMKVPPESIRVPVIGGATPKTMVPVLSAAIHPMEMTQEQVECITSCIMSGNEAVCAAKGCCTETACLAGAYAIARNTINILKGLTGQTPVIQCGYVDHQSTCVPDCQYFACEVELGLSGIVKYLGIPELSKFENCLLYNCLHYIRNEIARANWLVYTVFEKCPCAFCFKPPCPCNSDPMVPCKPPANWTCDCPDVCRDEYLISICREMTYKCGGADLCWKPRDGKYDAARAANLTHQLKGKSEACVASSIPKSVRIEEQIRQRAKNPCVSNQ